MADPIEQVLRQIEDAADVATEERILVIDDEPVICALLSAALEGDDREIRTVEDAETAFAVMKDWCPRIVLTDKNLPGANGIEVIRQGKKIAPDAEFIMITGYASLETAVEAMDLGAFGYVTKPFRDIHEIQRRVERALEKNALLHKNRALVERLEGAYRNLYEAKVEIDMMSDVTSERLKLRSEELSELLEQVVKPIVAVASDVDSLAEFVELAAATVDGGTAAIGRLKMLAGLLKIAQRRAEKVSLSLATRAE